MQNASDKACRKPAFSTHRRGITCMRLSTCRLPTNMLSIQNMCQFQRMVRKYDHAGLSTQSLFSQPLKPILHVRGREPWQPPSAGAGLLRGHAPASCLWASCRTVRVKVLELGMLCFELCPCVCRIAGSPRVGSTESQAKHPSVLA